VHELGILDRGLVAKIEERAEIVGRRVLAEGVGGETLDEWILVL
jgi:hypothetical protein